MMAAGLLLDFLSKGVGYWGKKVLKEKSEKGYLDEQIWILSLLWCTSVNWFANRKVKPAFAAKIFIFLN